MPTARGGLTAAAPDGRLHVTGGEDRDTSETFAQHEVYDPATGRWITLVPLPTPRHGLTSQNLGGRWYAIGGGAKAGRWISSRSPAWSRSSPPDLRGGSD
jgi:hypothetical protein